MSAATAMEGINMIRQGLGTWIADCLGSGGKPPLALPTLPVALARAQSNLAWAKSCYNQATDADMADYAIYQMLAAESEYRYFLRKARSGIAEKADQQLRKD